MDNFDFKKYLAEGKEIKSNKMKKSELKEMIRNAFLNKTEIEEKESFDDAFDRIDKEEELYPKNTQDPKSQPGYISEEEDKEEVEVDAEEIDADTDAETIDADEVDIEIRGDKGLKGPKKEIDDSLEAAIEAARELGDEKLIDQIGNTITFFTRAHVVGKGEVEEGVLNENKEEARYELEEIMDQLYRLSDQAKMIFKNHFPAEYSRLNAYGALDFGTSSNRYDVTLEGTLENLGIEDDDEDMMQEESFNRFKKLAGLIK